LKKRNEEGQASMGNVAVEVARMWDRGEGGEGEEGRARRGSAKTAATEI
jgi:hypothetical protein